MIGSWPLRFGAFFAPFHPVGQNPTLALEYDLDRVVAVDRLGYDEVCTHGLQDFAGYFGGGAGFVPLANQVDGGPRTPREFVEAYAESGNVVIGTPDDAIAYIVTLLEQSGGFGTFLLLGHDWADPEATLRSYRLFAREVIPHFTGQLAAPRASHEWAVDKRGELFGAAGQAILDAITSHVEEAQAKVADREGA
jgi:limonene 1,2-monooxygenase